MQEQKIILNGRRFRRMISAEQIEHRIEELASTLNRQFEGRNPIFIGVLSGSFLFLSDLVRKVHFDCQVAFVQLSSYNGTESTGCVKSVLDVEDNIEGRDVIIVEDIIETGHTMSYLLNNLRTKHPASITLCTLFYKPEKFLYDYSVDYPLFTISNEFIVGYGLDYDQLGRNLKDIYVIDE